MKFLIPKKFVTLNPCKEHPTSKGRKCEGFSLMRTRGGGGRALLEWETTAPTRQSQLQACSSKARDLGGASTLNVRADQTFHCIFVFPWRLEVNLSEEAPPKKGNIVSHYNSDRKVTKENLINCIFSESVEFNMSLGYIAMGTWNNQTNKGCVTLWPCHLQ